MDKTLYRIAAVLALIMGALAVFAGGTVLLGRDPGYYVIRWLLVYNFVVGVLTVLVTSVLIWRRSHYAMAAALATFGAHAIVMLLLQTAFDRVVAVDSIRAMTIRLVTWLAILALLFFGSRKRLATPAG
jgi:hypothetical protein